METGKYLHFKIRKTKIHKVQTPQLKYGQRIWNWIHRKKIQMSNKYKKTCLTLEVNKEIQNKNEISWLTYQTDKDRWKFFTKFTIGASFGETVPLINWD